MSLSSDSVLPPGADASFTEALPRFKYTEVFKEDCVYQGFSTGNGIFRDLPIPPALDSDFAFIVRKHRIENDVVVTVQSDTLRHSLSAALHLPESATTVFKFGLQFWFENYKTLKSYLAEEQSTLMEQDWSTTEFRLLTRDFLLDRSIFESFGLEELCEQGILSTCHWHDMQHWSTQRGLDDLNNIFFSAATSPEEFGGPDAPESSLEWDTTERLHDIFLPAVTSPEEFGGPDVPESSSVWRTPEHLDNVFLSVAPSPEEFRGTDILETSSTCDTPECPVTPDISEMCSPLHDIPHQQTAGRARRTDPSQCLLDDSTQRQLIIATTKGDLEFARAILDKKIGVIDASCLTVALERGEFEMFQLFLSHGARVDGHSTAGRTEPLYTASRRGHFEEVRALLRHGARLNGCNIHTLCDSPLTGAAEGGHLAIVRYLLNQNARLDGNGREYPLVSASQYGHLEVVECLLAHGADASKGWLQSPLDAAMEGGHLRIVDRLLARGAELHSSWLETAAKNDDLKMVKLLSSHGACRDKTAYTFALFAAIRRCNLRVVQYLSHLSEAWGQLDRHTICALDTAATKCGHPEIHQLVRDQARFPWYLWMLRPKFTLAEPFLLFMGGTPLYPKNCSVTAPIRAKEQWKLGSRLHNALLQTHLVFLKKTRAESASPALTAFGEDLSDYRDVWKEGMSAIEQLLNNRLPTNLKQVFSCLQVASTMSTVGQNGKFILSRETFRKRREFLNDLHRWRFEVPDTEKTLYDEIVAAVWGASWQETYTPLENVTEGYRGNLELFQKMVTSLISETNFSHVTGDGLDPGGYRLHTIHAQYDTNPLYQQFSERRGSPGASPTGLYPEGHKKKRKREPLMLRWYPVADPRVVAIMATAALGIILAFLLLMRCAASSLQLLHSTSIDVQEALIHAQGITFNRLVITLYLGLRVTLPLENRDDFDGRTPPWPEQQHAMASELETISSQLEFMANLASPPISSDQGGSFPKRPDITGRAAFPPSVSQTSHSSISGASPTESPSSSASATRPQCPRCFQTFRSVGNLNKHFNVNCHYGPKQKLQCRNSGCQKMLKTEWYRKEHEKKSCHYRCNRLAEELRVGEQQTGEQAGREGCDSAGPGRQQVIENGQTAGSRTMMEGTHSLNGSGVDYLYPNSGGWTIEELLARGESHRPDHS